MRQVSAVGPAEAAKYAGSTTSTLAKYRMSGLGPKFVKIGRRVVYRIQDLDAWLASNCRQSTSDAGIPRAA